MTRRWTRVSILLGGVVLIGGLAAGVATVATASESSPPSGCGTVHGPFRTTGATVLDGSGTQFTSYGTTVPGLDQKDYRQSATIDDAKIDATAQSWCGNTVRLQIAQANLVGTNGTTFSQPFLSAIEAEVTHAEHDGLVVVLTAQTEGFGGHQPAPTEATRAFWQRLAGVYGSDPQVVFDLFNEPRLKFTQPGGGRDEAKTWQFWQHGGQSGGVTYLGMQDLVNQVRADKATNLLWVEGPYTATTLDEVPTHPVTGGPLAYAMHHPAGQHNPAAWDRDFGFLVEKGIAPVVEGEWSNWAAARGECWTDAPTAVPSFLSYLTDHHFGLNVWQLAKGVMIESDQLNDPTQIRANWKCANGLDEGAGAQVMAMFKRNNGH